MRSTQFLYCHDQGVKAMARPIRFNAFSMNAASHQSPGLWRHPRNTSVAFNRLGYWTDLAQLLERGLFDALFIADVLGIYDVYQGGPHAALRGGRASTSQRSIIAGAGNGRSH